MRARRLGALIAVPLVALALASAAGGAEPSQGKGAPAGGTQAAPAEKAAAHKSPGPQVPARSWAVIDGRTGEVLTSHAGNKRLPIASTTKLMTAYVTLKDLSPNKIVRAQPYEAEYGESLMGLRTGQRISVQDLLYGLVLRSGNDAANTLAIDAAGSVPKFVAQMNRYAAALGLTNTHYANPIGLDQKGNYSSALDLVTLARELEKIPAFAKVADSREAVLRSVHPRRRIHTINALLEMAPWVTGVKTGHTWKAGYVLVGSGRKNGVDLISAAIGAPTDETRFSDNLELLEWGFGQYHRHSPVRRGEEFASPSIEYSGGELPLRAANTLTVSLRPHQQAAVDIQAPEEVVGPIARGARLGRATVTVDGLRVGSVGLVASRAVAAASSFDKARDFVEEHPVPIAVAVCAILIAAMLLGRQIRRIRRGKRVQK